MDHIISVLNIYREHSRVEFKELSRKAQKSREWEQQFEAYCNDEYCHSLWYHTDNKEEQKQNTQKLEAYVRTKYPLLLA